MLLNINVILVNMVRYIGIAKERGDQWYTIDFMLYDRMLKLTLYTKRFKRPTYYWTGNGGFDYAFNTEDVSIYHFKWFFGLKIG